MAVRQARRHTAEEVTFVVGLSLMLPRIATTLTLRGKKRDGVGIDKHNLRRKLPCHSPSIGYFISIIMIYNKP